MGSDKRIIRLIIKEEIQKMEERTTNRLFEWYDSWNQKLKILIEAEDYTKIMSTHFKTGLTILSLLKKTDKPEALDKINLLRDKLRLINQVRKTIEGLK